MPLLAPPAHHAYLCLITSIPCNRQIQCSVEAVPCMHPKWSHTVAPGAGLVSTHLSLFKGVYAVFFLILAGCGGIRCCSFACCGPYGWHAAGSWAWRMPQPGP